MYGCDCSVITTAAKEVVFVLPWFVYLPLGSLSDSLTIGNYSKIMNEFSLLC